MIRVMIRIRLLQIALESNGLISPKTGIGSVELYGDKKPWLVLGL